MREAELKARKRDPYRANWCASDLRTVCGWVFDGLITRQEANARGWFPRQTLDSALHRGGRVTDELGRAPLMLRPESDRFVRFLLDRQDANCPLPREASGVLAAEILALRHIRFGTKDGLPSRSWYKHLHEQYPAISLRTPSPLSFKALTSISVDNTKHFFVLVRGVKESLKVPDSHIMNLDQTMAMVSSKERVWGRDGQHRVRSMAADRSHVSFQPHIMGDGRVLPCHVFIFKGKWPPYFKGVTSNQDSFDLPPNLKKLLPEAAFLATGLFCVCSCVVDLNRRLWLAQRLLVSTESATSCVLAGHKLAGPRFARRVPRPTWQRHDHRSVRVCAQKQADVLVLPIERHVVLSATGSWSFP